MPTLWCTPGNPFLLSLYVRTIPTTHREASSIRDTETRQSRPVLKSPVAQDFAEPAWTLSLYPYVILDGGKYGAFTAFEKGRNVLYIIGLTQPSVPVPIDNFDYTVAQHLRPASANCFVFTGIKAAEPGGVIMGTVSGSPSSYTVTFETHKSSGVVPPELKNFISPPVPMTLRDPSNPLYVVYYVPKNPNYSGIPGEKPPCIVGVHDGPTGMEPQALNWIKMFYTSRGFAWYALTCSVQIYNLLTRQQVRGQLSRVLWVRSGIHVSTSYQRSVTSN